MSAPELLPCAERAASKLEQMAREFNSPHFTDRYGDGPAMASIAKELRTALAAHPGHGKPDVQDAVRLKHFGWMATAHEWRKALLAGQTQLVLDAMEYATRDYISGAARGAATTEGDK